MVLERYLAATCGGRARGAGTPNIFKV